MQSNSNLYTGVGQSEFAVADMVDMFVLLIPPAGGDELQVHTLSLLDLYSHRSDSQTRSMGPQQTSMETLRWLKMISVKINLFQMKYFNWVETVSKTKKY